MRPSLFASLSVVSIILVFGDPGIAQPEREPEQNPWGRCCGGDHWSDEGGMMGPGVMGPGGGSMQRHHVAMMSGVPSAYASLKNPLPQTRETVSRGRAVYERACAACHGATGQGDGDAGRNLSPRPGNLARLARMPMVRWDPFMYWTVAEGGAAFETAMPAFKGSLSSEEIWAVIAYIQARLPAQSK